MSHVPVLARARYLCKNSSTFAPPSAVLGRQRVADLGCKLGGDFRRDPRSRGSAVVLTAHPRRRAQRRSRMPAGHRRRRRAASWTAASRRHPHRRDGRQRDPDRSPASTADQDAPFRRGFVSPLTLAPRSGRPARYSARRSTNGLCKSTCNGSSARNAWHPPTARHSSTARNFALE